jgi:hypothetical protein
MFGRIGTVPRLSNVHLLFRRVVAAFGAVLDVGDGNGVRGGPSDPHLAAVPLLLGDELEVLG